MPSATRKSLPCRCVSTFYALGRCLNQGAPVSRWRVLLVEDEHVLRQATERMLALHFEVVAVGAVDEAIGALQRFAFDVVVTDVLLGDNAKRGEELLVYVESRHPRIARIVLSGTPPSRPELAHVILRKGDATISEIVDAVRVACERGRPFP